MKKMLAEKRFKKKSKEIQKDCHEFTKFLMGENKDLTLNDCQMVWIYEKFERIEVFMTEMNNSRFGD